jgi:uncharacterized membrane protein YesL
MEMRGLMGGLYKVSEWIMRLSGTNLLWFIFSIPFFFMLVPMLVPVQGDADPKAVLIQMAILAAIVAPFTLFPATTAMFSVARKWVMGEADVPIIKTFWKGYRENYKQSMLGGFLYAILGVVLIMNYSFYAKQTGTLNLLSILFIVFMVVVLSSLLYFFSLLSHLHMKTLQILKNAIVLTIGNPIGTIVMIVGNLGIMYISIFHYTFLIPFFMGSLCASVTFFMFYKTFLTIQIRQEQYEREQREKELGEGSTDEEIAGAVVKPVVTPGPELIPVQSAEAAKADAEEKEEASEKEDTAEAKEDEKKTDPDDNIYLDDTKYTQFHKKFKE